jgi:hypothetical protein
MTPSKNEHVCNGHIIIHIVYLSYLYLLLERLFQVDLYFDRLFDKDFVVSNIIDRQVHVNKYEFIVFVLLRSWNY